MSDKLKISHRDRKNPHAHEQWIERKKARNIQARILRNETKNPTSSSAAC